MEKEERDLIPDEVQGRSKVKNDEKTLEDLVSLLVELQNGDVGGISLTLLREYLLKLKEFNDEFVLGVSEADRIMSLSDVESLIMKLIDSQKELAKDLAWEKAKSLDEGPHIRKKKTEYEEKGVRLRIWRRFPRTVVTLFGKFQIERTALIPSTAKDKSKLAEMGRGKMIFPLDEALGLDLLPYKISVRAMLEITRRARDSSSYAAAARSLRRDTLIDVKEDTMREVANHVGSLVFNADVARAEKTWAELNSGKLRFPAKKERHELYVEVDGAMIHTRRKPAEENSVEAEGEKKETKSNWMENKLGMVFNSKDFRWWTDKTGQKQHVIGKREYTAFIGPVEQFKKLLFSMLIRNNYGKYDTTILISDGAPWIKSMKDEIFPDAYHILDFYHLCENVTKFAKEIFDQDESKYKQWSKVICDAFKESKINFIINKIHNFSNKKLLKCNFNLLNYINSNINNINYALYQKRGWYIGSGAIESSNKTVLQYRLKQAGMRWNKENGQFIVTLMAKEKSGLWESDVIAPVRKLYEI
jgi:hypothetical protein